MIKFVYYPGTEAYASLECPEEDVELILRTPCPIISHLHRIHGCVEGTPQQLYDYLIENEMLVDGKFTFEFPKKVR